MNIKDKIEYVKYQIETGNLIRGYTDIYLFADEVMTVLAELEKQEKIIDEMAGYLHIIRDCPNENCGADIDCENRCSNDDDVIKECWIKYFERKVEK